MKVSISRNKREGYYLGCRIGRHFRCKVKCIVGEDMLLFAHWCDKVYGWEKYNA